MAFVSSVALRGPVAGGRCAVTRCAPARHIAAAPRRAQQPACSAAAPSTPHPDALEATWPPFAETMRATDVVPDQPAWHALLQGCVRANDKPSSAIWLLNLMRDVGRTPTAVTYELVMQVCLAADDRAAVFHLVELMYKDKVLLGDVELPEDMEDLLRKILPPEAFE